MKVLKSRQTLIRCLKHRRFRRRQQRVIRGATNDWIEYRLTTRDYRVITNRWNRYAMRHSKVRKGISPWQE